MAKYLREVAQRAQEATVLRVLPKAQQLEQLVAQEQMMRDVLVAEEWSNRTTVQNKRADEYNKRVMSQLAARNKATQELMKKQHADEMTAQKTLVAESQKTTDNEIRDKLQLVNQLQPRNTVVAAALADLKKEGGDLAVIGELLEEEKRLRKALKADVRFQSSASAGEGGAFTFWLKQCIASSFNAAAILSASPLRAAVADVVGFPSKLAQEKRVLTVRRVEDDKHVLLWAQARCLVGEPAETAAAASNLIEKASAVFSEAISMVLWSKEDYAELSKLAKQSEEVAAVNPKSNSVLRVEGVASVPLSNKEVQALAETAATL